MNKFGDGVEIAGGYPNRPGMRFMNSLSSGFFSYVPHMIGVASYGQVCAMFTYDTCTIYTDFALTKNPINNGVLTSDAHGLARWKLNNLSGTYQWNKLYNDLVIYDNEDSNDVLNFNNKTAEITFSASLGKIPNVIISKESDIPVTSVDFYVKDKTASGFKICSDKFMAKKIIGVEFTYFSSCELSSGGIGIVYYDVSEDRMKYIYSNSTYSVFSAPIVIDDSSAIGLCDINIVDGNPAVAYIADDGSEDKWRYVRASNSDGSSWGASVTLEQSSKDITFLTNAIFLKVLDGVPTVFFNNDSGRAKYIKAQDSTGLTWNTSANLSNLTNHQIVDVKIISGNPAIIACSNLTKYIYYARSNNAAGTSWPIGATQLYKPGNVAMSTNVGDCCNTIAIIHDMLCVITSEFNSNSIYIAWAEDLLGSSWGAYQLLATSSTTNAYPYVFKNGLDYYLMYNLYNGSPSQKNIIRFKPDFDFEDLSSVKMIETLPYCMGHQSIATSDSNMLLVSASESLILLRFFGDDFKINWVAL